MYVGQSTKIQTIQARVSKMTVVVVVVVSCYSLLLHMYCMVLQDRVLYDVRKISNLWCTQFSSPFILDTKLITTLQFRYIATFDNTSHHFMSEDVSLCDE